MGILDDDVARVRDATDLVALAGEHLALKRVGKRFIGLCPFHAEKTPSFNVNPEMGRYYCLAGETRVITWDGVKPIRELAGTSQRILDEPWPLGRCNLPLVRCPAADEDHDGPQPGTEDHPCHTGAPLVRADRSRRPPRTNDRRAATGGRALVVVPSQSERARISGSRRSASRTGSRSATGLASRRVRASTSTARRTLSS